MIQKKSENFLQSVSKKRILKVQVVLLNLESDVMWSPARVIRVLKF